LNKEWIALVNLKFSKFVCVNEDFWNVCGTISPEKSNLQVMPFPNKETEKSWKKFHKQKVKGAATKVYINAVVCLWFHFEGCLDSQLANVHCITQMYRSAKLSTEIITESLFSTHILQGKKMFYHVISSILLF
jgi:hypothetical protein